MRFERTVLSANDFSSLTSSQSEFDAEKELLFSEREKMEMGRSSRAAKLDRIDITWKKTVGVRAVYASWRWCFWWLLIFKVGAFDDYQG